MIKVKKMFRYNCLIPHARCIFLEILTLNEKRLRMKLMTNILFKIVFATGMMLWATSAVAADSVEVLKIETLMMEKGADNVSLTVKVFVKNNGDPADIAVGVVALDGEGFELEKITVNGLIKNGQTKVLVGIVKVPSDVYGRIVKWEWKK